MRTRNHDDDSFDERGILKDGARSRTPLYMMDSMRREIHEQSYEDTVKRDALSAYDARERELMADGGSAAAHRPGWAADPRRGFARSMRDGDPRLAAYDEVEQRDVNAWREQQEADDSVFDAEVDAAMAAALEIADPKERAYAVRELQDQNAWRGR